MDKKANTRGNILLKTILFFALGISVLVIAIVLADEPAAGDNSAAGGGGIIPLGAKPTPTPSPDGSIWDTDMENYLTPGCVAVWNSNSVCEGVISNRYIDHCDTNDEIHEYWYYFSSPDECVTKTSSELTSHFREDMKSCGSVCRTTRDTDPGICNNKFYAGGSCAADSNFNCRGVSFTSGHCSCFHNFTSYRDFDGNNKTYASCLIVYSTTNPAEGACSDGSNQQVYYDMCAFNDEYLVEYIGTANCQNACEAGDYGGASQTIINCDEWCKSTEGGNHVSGSCDSSTGSLCPIGGSHDGGRCLCSD